MELRVLDPNCVVHHLPNAIDLQPYRGLAKERMAGAGSNGIFQILYLGYLGRAKGSYDLIDAMRRLISGNVEAICHLVGEELTRGEKDGLRKRIIAAKLEKSARLHPPVFGLQKLNFFRDADVLVCPSHHEGMPMVVLEAMACGLPIIATNVGGLPDLVQNGVNGLLVPPGQPDQLAAALHQLAFNDELRRSMQLSSYRLASERYDMERRVSQLVDVYQAALSRNGVR
jgi:glycosyltransferase involved in cell wall biosynthesis